MSRNFESRGVTESYFSFLVGRPTQQVDEGTRPKGGIEQLFKIMEVNDEKKRRSLREWTGPDALG